MNWNKNILQFLFSCFIIANLTTALGFTTTIEVNPVKQNIELLTSKRALTYHVINFDEAQKQLYLTNTPQISSEVGWFNRIKIINQKTDLQLKTQNKKYRPFCNSD